MTEKIWQRQLSDPHRLIPLCDFLPPPLLPFSSNLNISIKSKFLVWKLANYLCSAVEYYVDETADQTDI